MRMTQVLDELIALLQLERIEENLFRGQSQDLGWGTVFGGQVLGQALSAAIHTVEPSRSVHSLHAYFLRPGNVHQPIVYDVDRIRDGKSFTTRRVVAIQKGRPIFNLSASFQEAETGFEHADAMPAVAGPEGLQSERELWAARLDQIPKRLHAAAMAERPIELRPVDSTDPFRPKPSDPDHAVWLRAAKALDDNPALHQMLLAYSSDFAFVGTSLRPHAATWLSPEMHVASVDHAMWFHRPFRMDDWLLHVMHSPSASGARGFVRGQIFTQDGTLVASTAQEGLIRKRPRG